MASGAQRKLALVWLSKNPCGWLLFEHLPPSLISSHGCVQWEQGEEDEAWSWAVMAPGKGRRS